MTNPFILSLYTELTIDKKYRSGLLLMAEMKRDLNYKSRDINLCQFKLK